MKQIFETIAVAFGMFSALPVKQPEWDRQNMRYALLAFPLVGLACGLAWWGIWLLCDFLPVPGLLRGALLALAPIWITGGIHLDGYADTCDALASWSSPERRQEILKDPHCGAFAVIRLGCYLILWYALCASIQLEPRALRSMTLVFLLSRALSGRSVAAFPLARNTGLAHTFATAADRERVGKLLLAFSVLLSLGLVSVGRWAGLAAALAGWLVFLHYRWTALRQFGGLSGDLAGWFLQRAELWMLAALVAAQMMEELL